VAVLRSQLDDHLSLAERFDRGNRDSSTEKRLRPHLERLLSGDGGISTWNLECRNQVCKLHVVESGEGMEWSQIVQRDKDIQRMNRGIQFVGSTPNQNPTTGETLTAGDAWLQIADEDEMKLSEPLNRLLDSFKASSALADCTNDYQVKGALVARLELGESGLSYQYSGTLAPTPAGRCIAERLQAMGAASGLPSQSAKPVTSVARFRSPPEP
jgi:hypothetical protein